MDAVTYPQEKVIDFISKNVVPLQIAADEKPTAVDYDVTWTPSMLIIDAEGKEYHRVVGFLSPEEIVPAILLGMGKAYFSLNKFDKALQCLEKITREHGASDAAPEALYLFGVCSYKNTNDPMPLRQAYDSLAAKYPENMWTRRAYPYRLIGA